MAEVLLFHHAQGLTEGVVAFADRLRAAGHTVHTPDLYEGNVFATLDEGLGYARADGFGTVIGRGVQAADTLPAGLVYAGFSLGVMAAQQLAQNRPGARGALLLRVLRPDLGVRRALARRGARPGARDGRRPLLRRRGRHRRRPRAGRRGEDGELFVYPGDRHLFADSSLATYDAEASALLTQRVLDFLARLSRLTGEPLPPPCKAGEICVAGPVRSVIDRSTSERTLCSFAS